MSKLYLGSIDLSKVDKRHVKTLDGDGMPFKNGAKYLNIAIWLNDEPDKYGNHLAIKAGPKDESYYIGNAKEFVQMTPHGPALPPLRTPEPNEDDGLPF